MGMQGGKRIVGDLGAGGGDGANEGGFAGMGSPSNPISASTFNSRLSLRCSPVSRGALRGVRFVLDLKLTLPRPPLPPARAMRTARARRDRRAFLRFPGSLITGRRARATRHHRHLCRCIGHRRRPRVPRAVNAREAVFDEGVDVPVGDRIDAAPLPPSPPSGPPRGTFFSRLKLTAPSPPCRNGPRCALRL